MGDFFNKLPALFCRYPWGNSYVYVWHIDTPDVYKGAGDHHDAGRQHFARPNYPLGPAVHITAVDRHDDARRVIGASEVHHSLGDLTHLAGTIQ